MDVYRGGVDATSIAIVPPATGYEICCGTNKDAEAFGSYIRAFDLQSAR
jgi:hypothetical protein